MFCSVGVIFISPKSKLREVEDALRALSKHQCAQDLLEEFVCAEAGLLRAGQEWFTVIEEKCKDKGIKCPDIELKERWERVLSKVKRRKLGVKRVANLVQQMTSKIARDMTTAEVHSVWEPFSTVKG